MRTMFGNDLCAENRTVEVDLGVMHVLKSNYQMFILRILQTLPKFKKLIKSIIGMFVLESSPVITYHNLLRHHKMSHTISNKWISRLRVLKGIRSLSNSKFFYRRINTCTASNKDVLLKESGDLDTGKLLFYVMCGVCIFGFVREYRAWSERCHTAQKFSYGPEDHSYHRY